MEAALCALDACCCCVYAQTVDVLNEKLLLPALVRLFNATNMGIRKFALNVVANLNCSEDGKAAFVNSPWRTATINSDVMVKIEQVLCMLLLCGFCVQHIAPSICVLCILFRALTQ